MKDAPTAQEQSAKAFALWRQAVDAAAKAKKATSLAREGRPPIENLVFEGGGVKGAVYAGVLDVLQQKNLLKDVKRVAGSSAGGIVSLLMAVGYNPSEIKEIMTTLDFKQLMDRRVKTDPTRIISAQGVKIGVSDIYSLFKHKGVFKGDAFVKLAHDKVRSKLEDRILLALIQNSDKELKSMELSKPIQEAYDEDPLNMLKNKAFRKKLLEHYSQELNAIKDELLLTDFANITFSQLQHLRELSSEARSRLGLGETDLGLKELFLTGTNLSDISLKEFSHLNDPNMSIVEAVRITMSFPLGFEPYLYQGHYYADGGIADNYPMGIFDKPSFLSHGVNDSGVNPCTLGFLVDTNDEIEARWGIAANLAEKEILKALLLSKKYPKIHKNESIKKAISIINADIDNRNKGKKKDDQEPPIKKVTKDNVHLFISPHYISYTRNAFKQEIKEFVQALNSPDKKNLANLDPQDVKNLQNFIKKNPTGRSFVKDQGIEKLDFSNLKLTFPGLLGAVVAGMHNRSEILQKYYSNNSVQIFDENIPTLDFNLSNKSKAALVRSGYKAMLEHYDNYLRLEAGYDIRGDYKEIQHKYYNKGPAELKRIINNEIKPALAAIEDLTAKLDVDVKSELSRLEKDTEKNQQAIAYLEKFQVFAKIAKEQKKELEKHQNVALTMLHYYEPDLERKPFVQTELKRVPEDSHTFANKVDISYIDELYHLATYRLNAGNWGNDISAPTKDDIRHNKSTFINAEGEKVMPVLDVNNVNEHVKIYGKHESQFTVSNFKYNQKYVHSTLGKTIKEKVAPIQARFLTVEDQALKNPNRKVKDLQVLFLEPVIERKEVADKTKNFKEIEKNTDNREKYFQQCEQELLKQLSFELKRIQRVKMEPSDAKIRLTIYGEGLAGQDAQYMMAAVLRKLANPANDDDEVMRALLGQVELNLVDPCKVRKKLAIKAAENIKKIKSKDNAPEIASNTVLHYKIHPDQRTSYRTQAYLGEANLMSRVDPELSQVKLHRRAKQAEKRKEYPDETIVYNVKEKLCHAEDGINPSSNLYNSESYRKANVAINALKEPRVKFRNAIKKIKSKKSADKPESDSDDTVAEQDAAAVVQPPAESIPWKERYAALKQAQAESQTDIETKVDQVTQSSQGVYRMLQPPIQNLVFEGGGVKGTVYAGALSVLDSEKAPGQSESILKGVKRVAGSSAGGITASLVAMGLNADELKDYLNKELNFKELMDAPRKDYTKLISASGMDIGFVGLYTLFKDKGLYKGDKFVEKAKTKYSETLTDKIKMMVLAKMDRGSVESKTDVKLEEYLDNEVIATIKDVNKVIQQKNTQAKIDALISVLKSNRVDYKTLKDNLVAIGLPDDLFNGFNDLESALNDLKKGDKESDRYKDLYEQFKKHLKGKIDHTLFMRNSSILINEIDSLSDITFAQLRILNEQYPQMGLKELYVTGTKVSNGDLKVFSADSTDTQNMPIVDAVRITMSFPGGFMPKQYGGEYYIDGGVADNYPMHIFDDEKFFEYGKNDAGVNPCTLGFLVDSKEEIKFRWGEKLPEQDKIKLTKLIGNVLASIHNRAEILRDKYNINSIQIDDLGVPTMDLNMSDKTKRDLVESGVKATRFYVENCVQVVVGDQGKTREGDEKVKPITDNELETYLARKYNTMDAKVIEKLLLDEPGNEGELIRLKKELDEVTEKVNEITEPNEKQALIAKINKAKESLDKEIQIAKTALENKGPQVSRFMQKATDAVALDDMRKLYESQFTNAIAQSTLAVVEHFEDVRNKKTSALSDSVVSHVIHPQPGVDAPVILANTRVLEKDKRNVVSHRFSMQKAKVDTDSYKNGIEAMAQSAKKMHELRGMTTCKIVPDGATDAVKEKYAEDLALKILEVTNGKVKPTIKEGKLSEAAANKVLERANERFNSSRTAVMQVTAPSA